MLACVTEAFSYKGDKSNKIHVGVWKKPDDRRRWAKWWEMRQKDTDADAKK